MKLCDTVMPSVRFRYAAISRLDQWLSPVPSGGEVRVSATMRDRTRSGTSGGRPGFGRSANPSTPDSPYRSSHLYTVGLVAPDIFAMSATE
jgi:hypothetical protein